MTEQLNSINVLHEMDFVKRSIFSSILPSEKMLMLWMELTSIDSKEKNPTILISSIFSIFWATVVKINISIAKYKKQKIEIYKKIIFRIYFKFSSVHQIFVNYSTLL